MRLFFLDPIGSTAINVNRLKKSGFNLRKLVASYVSKIDTMIILGDGTPDDQVIGVLAHHMNGSKIVGVVKPKSTNFGAVDQMKTYLQPNIRKVVFLIDQDDLDLDSIFQNIIQRIQETGISVVDENKTEEASTRGYNCSFSNRHYELIIVINGLDEIPTEKHTIEDHLIQVADLQEDCRRQQNSKKTWQRLSKTDKHDILRRLLDRTLAYSNFPQQVAAFSKIEN